MSEDWSSIVSKMVKSSFLHKLISLNENQSYQDSDESYHTKMSNFGTFWGPDATMSLQNIQVSLEYVQFWPKM